VISLIPKLDTCYGNLLFLFDRIGAVGISNYVPVSKEKLEVLKRFRNVFLTWHIAGTRILSLRKHRRWNSNEVSLERVRAQAMSMKKAG